MAVSNQFNIQWFPGHMAKAKREISQMMKLVDLVIELKDARIPYSSTNPMINEIIGSKPRLILLNKAEMADKKITKDWINYYKDNNIIALDIDSITGYNIKNIIPYAKIVLADEFKKREARGIKKTSIRAMILGIPNVGKSTLINKLAKRKAVNVGDKPGVTKTQSWIKISPELDLLDTPGILWPKFEDEIVGIKLAMCGSIKDDILDLEALSVKSLDYLKENYPDNLMNRYNLDNIEIDSHDLLEVIANKRGCILKGGIPDLERVEKLIMNELRDLKIGRMSYEKPEGRN
jgi:ribosome biogenesis GTPase A